MHTDLSSPGTINDRMVNISNAHQLLTYHMNESKHTYKPAKVLLSTIRKNATYRILLGRLQVAPSIPGERSALPALAAREMNRMTYKGVLPLKFHINAT